MQIGIFKYFMHGNSFAYWGNSFMTDQWSLCCFCVFFIQTPTGLNPRTRLQWRRGADAPEEISGAQAVVMGERMYAVHNNEKVCQYNWRRDTWRTLPDCPVKWFCMAQFLGKLITVGGKDRHDSVTGKVYQFIAERWDELLPPMPTARSQLTVVTRTSCSSKPPAIAACGGCKAHCQLVDTVEVYSQASSQWHTAKPLPIPCCGMTSVTIDNISYILGGWDSTHSGTKCCFSVSFDSLIDNATSGHSQSIWKSVSDARLIWSTAASLRGSLLAIGGMDTTTETTSSAWSSVKRAIRGRGDSTSSTICVLTNDGSWKRVRGGNLPEPRHGSAAVCLPSGELLVAGGYAGIFDFKVKRTVLIASIVD